MLLALATLLLLPLGDAAPQTAASPEAVSLCSGAGRNHENIHIQDDRGKKLWRVKWTGENCAVEFQAEGDVQFAADAVSIQRISPGGSVEVNHRDGAALTRLRAVPDGASVKYEFWQNGQSRPFDAEGRQWLANFLVSLDRRSGALVESRFPALYANGPAAVLAEISRMSSDYGRAVYFRKLIAQKLDAATVISLLRAAGEQVSSDHELAGILLSTAAAHKLDDASRTAFLRASDTLQSDYERGRVLLGFAGRHRLAEAETRLVIDGAGRMKSDYERARVLIRVAEGGALPKDSLAAFMEAVTNMRSDYERRRVLTSVLEHNRNDAAAVAVLNASAGMRSDYERVQVLLAAAKLAQDNGSVRQAYLRATETVRSNYERERALRAIQAQAAREMYM